MTRRPTPQMPALLAVQESRRPARRNQAGDLPRTAVRIVPRVMLGSLLGLVALAATVSAQLPGLPALGTDPLAATGAVQGTAGTVQGQAAGALDAGDLALPAAEIPEVAIQQDVATPVGNTRMSADQSGLAVCTQDTVGTSALPVPSPVAFDQTLDACAEAGLDGAAVDAAAANDALQADLHAEADASFIDQLVAAFQGLFSWI